MTISVGRPLIDLIKLCYEADCPVLLSGRHGIGKSVILEQAARELGIGFIARDLSLMEPPDLTGLPKLDGKVTRYLPPSFLPTRGKGLLVLEELNRCAAYMRSPTLQLLTARTLNDFRLPTGWVPVAAINPDGEGYETDELDEALLSRFVRVDVVPDRDEWLAWAQANGVHPGVVAYVSADSSIFGAPRSNPRAWTYVSDVLLAAERAAAPAHAVRAAVAGLVGPERAAAFLKTLEDAERPLTAADLLDYRRHQKQFRGWIASGRLDLIRESTMALKRHLQARRNYEVARSSRSVWSGLAALLADLPGEWREDLETFFREREYEIPPTKGRRR